MSSQSRKRKANLVEHPFLEQVYQSPGKRRRSIPKADSLTSKVADEARTNKTSRKRKPNHKALHAEPRHNYTSQEPAKKRQRSSEDASTLTSENNSIISLGHQSRSNYDDFTPGQKSEFQSTFYSKPIFAETACRHDVSDEEIAPGTTRLPIKDNRKSLLENPEVNTENETPKIFSWTSDFEARLAKAVEREQNRANLAEEAKEKADANDPRKSRLEKLPQEIRDKVYGYVLRTDNRLQIASPELLTYENLRLQLESLEREASLAETISMENLEAMPKLQRNMSFCIDPSNRDPGRKNSSISEFRLFDISIFLVNRKIAEDALAVFYNQNHFILDPGEPWAERINGYWKVSMSEMTTARVKVARYLTLRIPYTFIQQTVDLLHDREDIKHLEVVMCVPEKEDVDHWHNLDYWTEPMKLLRHIRAKFFRTRSTLLTETVNLGMYREVNVLPLRQLFEGNAPSEGPQLRWAPLRFLQNLSDVVEGRPPRHKPEDVYPQNAKGQREGADFWGDVMPGFRKIPRIGPWT